MEEREIIGRVNRANTLIIGYLESLDKNTHQEVAKMIDPLIKDLLQLERKVDDDLFNRLLNLAIDHISGLQGNLQRQQEEIMDLEKEPTMEWDKLIQDADLPKIAAVLEDMQVSAAMRGKSMFDRPAKSLKKSDDPFMVGLEIGKDDCDDDDKKKKSFDAGYRAAQIDLVKKKALKQ